MAEQNRVTHLVNIGMLPISSKKAKGVVARVAESIALPLVDKLPISNCSQNANLYAAAHGLEVAYGWQVSPFQDAYELETHACCRLKDGSLVEVTESKEGWKFLEDSSVTPHGHSIIAATSREQAETFKRIKEHSTGLKGSIVTI